MKTDIFVITPPFTQLNTPYPASAYIKGFLNTKSISATQADLGIEVILALFSKDGLTALFEKATTQKPKQKLQPNIQRIIALQAEYIKTIAAVIAFLQGKNPTLALQICQRNFLPEAGRFEQLEELDWAFGEMGTQDKAKHLATLYLEDISDFIVACVDANFGFSRYAERLGRSANSFDELYMALQKPSSYIDEQLIAILSAKISAISPKLFMISVPFPGNLYAAFKCAQYVKQHYPGIKIAMGGGFANTELRSLSDPRVFEFFDFITLDDGELPTELLYENLSSTNPIKLYKRTFLLEDGKVVYRNDSLRSDYKQADVGTPDYSDLLLDQYISVIEVVNPMHRMWSDGRWNKLTMAHGCYWGKCTFCDISLPYIKVYEPVAAKLIVDRIAELIQTTGQTGFHFVDEAAPPALMREVALEILRRKLVLTWWTNIRFEKSFTQDLCLLLQASGCIAVSGGLEVASDRLLKLIDKGVTVEQVANVTRNFTAAGIMVHAYLMYGYPTQTEQETIDSLEMVRQLFEQGIVQSGFWHQFAMTAHSPVGINPEQFGVKRCSSTEGSFANNDLTYTDATGINHDKFSYGLKKSLFNYMHGICFDYKLQDWFDFKIPKTTIAPDFIFNAIAPSTTNAQYLDVKQTAKIVWLGTMPSANYFTAAKKGKKVEMAILTFHDKKESFEIQLERAAADWLCTTLAKLSSSADKTFTFQELKADYETKLQHFELFWYAAPINTLRDFGLLVL